MCVCVLLGAWELSLVVAWTKSPWCRISVPQPEIESVSPALEGRFLITGPPGSSINYFLNHSRVFSPYVTHPFCALWPCYLFPLSWVLPFTLISDTILLGNFPGSIYTVLSWESSFPVPQGSVTLSFRKHYLRYCTRYYDFSCHYTDDYKTLLTCLICPLCISPNVDIPWGTLFWFFSLLSWSVLSNWFTSSQELNFHLFITECQIRMSSLKVFWDSGPYAPLPIRGSLPGWTGSMSNAYVNTKRPSSEKPHLFSHNHNLNKCSGAQSRSLPNVFQRHVNYFELKLLKKWPIQEEHWPIFLFLWKLERSLSCERFSQHLEIETSLSVKVGNLQAVMLM